MYKPSKYTYVVEKNKDELLIYNTKVGELSCYILPKYRYDIFEMLRAEKVEKNEVSTRLYELGFLVEYATDEDEELFERFQRSVQDKQLNLIIAPTEECNFRCSYCCEEFSTKKMSNVTIQSIIKFVESRIDEVSSVNIDWFGGEPLLALDIINELSTQIIRICGKAKKNYSAFITTNGYLLDLNTFEMLYKNHVLTYQISLDAVDYIHDKQRMTIKGEPTFNTILDNLIKIRDSKVGRHATVLILTNLSKCVENDIMAFKKLFHTLFADDPRFEFSCARIMDLGGERIEKYRKNILNANEMNNMYSKMIEDREFPLKFNYHKFINPGNCLCYAGKDNSYLRGVDGRVYKCEHVFQTNKEQAIGYIDAQGKLIITDEMLEREWRAKWNNCGNKDCKLKPLCFGEDCIKCRIRAGKTQDNRCNFNLCHFEKETLEKILLLLEHETNLFRNISEEVPNIMDDHG